jgi:4-amino-4-deoxy-L-arabinose transferase-like glycosyltransferase
LRTPYNPIGSLKAALMVCLAICVVLFLCAYQARSYATREFDEGVYFASFKSVQHGFPLYQQTYMSQPPGFFVTTFPLYALFGSTLVAARLAVFFYSLVGLCAIVWLGWELKSVLFGFIAIGVLYLIPIYVNEILTFHGDSLPSAFSTLALAAVLRYRNTAKWHWLTLSAVCATTAVMIKGDVAVFPSILLVLAVTTLIEKRQIKRFIQLLAIFAATCLVTVLLFTLPFGINAVYDNVIMLRMRTAAGIAPDPNTFVNFFREQRELVDLFGAGVVLGIIAFITLKEARFPLILLLLWVLSTMLSLLVYRPLLPHHLAFLPIPITVLFSFALFKLLGWIKVPRLIPAAVTLFVVVVLLNRFNTTTAPQPGVATDLQRRGVELVQMHTQPDDFIISDDGIVAALSERRIPPDLTDISFVRIASGGVTAEKLENSLQTYQPKMVLVWADRLRNVPNFENIMQQYGYQLIPDPDTQHQAYLLES